MGSWRPSTAPPLRAPCFDSPTSPCRWPNADTAINDAVLARLKLKPGALRSLTVAKRSYDARKRGQIQ